MTTPVVDPILPLIVAVVAGLFALLGAFAGAALSRRTEYEKWLRERRSESYAKFLDLLSQAYSEASDALHGSALQGLEREIKCTQAYLAPINYAKVVRLYLPVDKRDEFSKLVNSIWALHGSTGLGDARMSAVQKKLDDVSLFLERHL